MSTVDQVSTPSGYPLRQLYCYLTGGCNLACRHCWIAPIYQTSPGTSPALDPALLQSILQQAVPLGLESVKLTGGEPLLHPRLDKILAMIRSAGLGLVVETNGLLCSSERVKQIAAVCENPAVAVSLDSPEAAVHDWVRGVEGAFEGALKGIRNLVAADIKPQVIMTIMRRNKDQLGAMVKLAESLGAGSVKFNVLQPTARGKQMHEQALNLSIRELVDLGAWVENELAVATPLRLVFDHPAAFRPLSRMFGEDGSGCGVCGVLGILGVLADGSYSLCGIGETVPELVFGHADSDDLAEIWGHNPILHEIRAGLPHRLEGVCSDCLLKGSCLGSCLAQNYYRQNDLWAPFWFCEEALKEGVFPETRLAMKR